MFGKIVIMLCAFAFGIGLIKLYVYMAKKRYGVQINVVQAVMYRVDTSDLPAKEKFIEMVLGFLKFLGLMMCIVGVFQMLPN